MLLKEIQFLFRFLFCSYVQVFSYEILPIRHLKCRYSFSSNFCFLVIVFLFVFILSLLFFLILYNVVYESWYWCIHKIFNADDFSSPFFSWQFYLSSVRHCAPTSTFLSSGPFVGVLPLSIFKMASIILHDSECFQSSQALIIFIFSECSDSFQIQ